MEMLKKIMCNLEECVLMQTENIENANVHEMDKACDMLKDVSMAMYYRQITESMNDAEYGKDYDEYGRIRTLDEVEDDIRVLAKHMSADERQMARQKMVNLANEIL